MARERQMGEDLADSFDIGDTLASADVWVAETAGFRTSRPPLHALLLVETGLVAAPPG
jgi:hypothetical protein